MEHCSSHAEMVQLIHEERTHRENDRAQRENDHRVLEEVREAVILLRSYFSLGGIIMRSLMPILWAVIGAGILTYVKAVQ